MTFRITIETLSGNILTFNKVESYELKDGSIIFKDSVTGKEKVFQRYNVEEEDHKPKEVRP